uniref:Uncharacterized protein n=1 Tax=Siphoviridae sp. ct0eR1 TaxID=2825297 RepID=A0A8S5UH41_9CAUD|nr:MAG TPA: hypothetical protein [Siphoviridae sp. ct0eR1]
MLIMIVRWLCDRERVRVDEWMVSVSRLCGVWNGGWCVLLLACAVRCVRPGPHSTSSVRGEYCVMSCTVPCRVCGAVRVSVCLCCSCDGVSFVCSPLVVVVGGAIVDGWAALWWWVA